MIRFARRLKSPDATPAKRHQNKLATEPWAANGRYFPQKLAFLAKGLDLFLTDVVALAVSEFNRSPGASPTLSRGLRDENVEKR
jgi:hypothetical protein